jgi:hypothetical protein
MKVLLSVSVTALVAASVVAPSAWATKPVKETIENEPVEFAAGEVCPFPYLDDASDQKTTLTTFSDGRQLIKTNGPERVTNLLTGESVSMHIAGSIVFEPLADGGVRATARGRLLLYYLPADVIGPALYLTIGRSVEIFDADGVITSVDSSGQRIDICAQLSQ